MMSTCCILAIAAVAQTHPQVKKALSDPNRAQKEAKADVYVQSKQQLTDCLQPASKAKPVTISNRKRTCKRVNSK
jgi:hypothetical protein